MPLQGCGCTTKMACGARVPAAALGQAAAAGNKGLAARLTHASSDKVAAHMLCSWGCEMCGAAGELHTAPHRKCSALLSHV
jgi:hypothetical protein